ncbi:MAG: hypothetical protein HC838_06510 [Spirulinaceae cyanobacterium RM2_2_10]|nr:hypothetical protein [Spirulinaceae cyanobacterium RM2_2_10]
MSFFFLLQLAVYLISLLALSRWSNQALSRWLKLDGRYLPAWSWGWVVYFFIYLVGRQFGLSVAWGRSLYTAIAFSIAGIALLRWAWQTRRHRKPRLPPRDELLTVLLVGLFVTGAIAVGPYLEFPSDPVDYFYRIQAWEKARWLNYGGLGQYATFASFSNHWLLKPSGVDQGDRTAVNILSALWQGLLFWESIRLAKVLTHSWRWGWLAGVLSLGYFGYNAISFYRYSTFAGAMLAQIVYLEALLVIFAVFLTERWRYTLLLIPLLTLAADSHLQAVLFQLNALVGCATLSLLFRYGTLTRAFRRRLVVLVGLSLSLPLCLLWRPIMTKISILSIVTCTFSTLPQR